MTPRLWAILVAGTTSAVAGYVMIAVGLYRYMRH